MTPIPTIYTLELEIGYQLIHNRMFTFVPAKKIGKIGLTSLKAGVNL